MIKTNFLQTMMRRLVSTLLLLLSTNSCLADAVVIKDVRDLNSVLKYITSEAPDVGKTLVILDIDDTLLESVNFVGSVKWYNWQRGKTVFNADGKVINLDESDKFHCIFSTLGTLFELGTAKLVQPDTAEVVNKLKAYDLMLLTSRTTDYRGATERELNLNGITLNDKHLLKLDTALIYPFNDGNRTAQITYHHGIVMSSGLNKGLVLQSILERLEASYQHIYFVDDSRNNLDDIAREWQQHPTKVRLFHYTRVDTTISEQEIDQSRVAKGLFDQFLRSAYPDRSQTFINGQCR